MKFSNPRDWSKDDLLDLMGLAPKRGFFELIFPAIGIFGAGLAVGAGIGMMLAPQSGPDLRRNLMDKYREKTTDLGHEIQSHPM